MNLKRFLKKVFRLRDNYTLENVFTPTSAANLNYISRPDIEKQIKRSLKIPGTQIILYGHSGGGKTTIIRKVLDNTNRKYIITSCVTGTKVDEIIVNAFDKLNPYYTSEKETKTTTKISSSLKAAYQRIEASLSSEITEETSQKQVRALPLQLTFERLGQFLGAAECVWIIEDFHKVDDAEKQKLSDIMKSFVDISNDYEKVKIVAIGAVSTAREVVNYNPDIKPRVSEIPVPLLSTSELTEIIENGAKLLNIEFDDKLITETAYYSNSLGSLCHQLCYSHCEEMEIEKTLKTKIKIYHSVLKKSIQGYVSQKSDTFQQKLDKALKQRSAKFQNVKLILNAFVNLEKENVTYNEILTKIQEWEPDYPQSNLTVYLKPLTTSDHDEMIRFDSNSGKYSFSDPFFKAFCAMALEKIDTPENANMNIEIESIIEKLNRLANEMSK